MRPAVLRWSRLSSDIDCVFNSHLSFPSSPTPAALLYTLFRNWGVSIAVTISLFMFSTDTYTIVLIVGPPVTLTRKINECKVFERKKIDV